MIWNHPIETTRKKLVVWSSWNHNQHLKGCFQSIISWFQVQMQKIETYTSYAFSKHHLLHLDEYLSHVASPPGSYPAFLARALKSLKFGCFSWTYLHNPKLYLLWNMMVRFSRNLPRFTASSWKFFKFASHFQGPSSIASFRKIKSWEIVNMTSGFRYLLFSPLRLYMGKWSNLTSICFKWVGSTTN